ncbi:MAG: cytochrome c oxidase assembly protein, partial [Jatrophihabitantaceae bacterium]
MPQLMDFLGTWSLDPIPAACLLVTAAGYLWAAELVRRRQPARPWPRRHTACFIAGIVLLWLAILGPVGGFDDIFFWAHMTQHLILTMLAAPLLVLGEPVLLILRVATPAWRRR